jgi:hypothetical protein
MKILMYCALFLMLAIACDANQSETLNESTFDTIENKDMNSLPPVTAVNDTVLQQDSIPPSKDANPTKKATTPKDTTQSDPRITRIINEKIRPKNQDTLKK